MHELDGKTGASLKLSILNPKGRIWTMVAGGGASVIYADTVGDLGYADELGNYAEYSGAPNTAVSSPRTMRLKQGRACAKKGGRTASPCDKRAIAQCPALGLMMLPQMKIRAYSVRHPLTAS